MHVNLFFKIYVALSLGTLLKGEPNLPLHLGAELTPPGLLQKDAQLPTA